MGLSRIDADRAACAAAPLVGSGPTPAIGPAAGLPPARPL